jgi:hypothetical protein
VKPCIFADTQKDRLCCTTFAQKGDFVAQNGMDILSKFSITKICCAFVVQQMILRKIDAFCYA